MATAVADVTKPAEDDSNNGWVDATAAGLLACFCAWAGYMMWWHPREWPSGGGKPAGGKTTHGGTEEVLFRAVKILDIGYVVALYIGTGIALGVLLSLALPAFDAKAADRQPFSVVVTEVIVHFWLLSVLVYAVRQVTEIFPSPLHGVAHFNHYRLKELNQPALFMVVLTQTQTSLLARVAYLIRRAKGL